MIRARLVFLKRRGLASSARPAVPAARASSGPSTSRGSGSGSERAMSDGISIGHCPVGPFPTASELAFRQPAQYHLERANGLEALARAFSVTSRCRFRRRRCDPVRRAWIHPQEHGSPLDAGRDTEFVVLRIRHRHPASRPEAPAAIVEPPCAERLQPVLTSTSPVSILRTVPHLLMALPGAPDFLSPTDRPKVR